MLGFPSLQPCLDQGKYVILEEINQIPNDSSPPIVTLEEVDDSTAKKIIIEIRHHEMVVMSGSQLMIHVLS